jgi:hypothetical protein
VTTLAICSGVGALRRAGGAGARLGGRQAPADADAERAAWAEGLHTAAVPATVGSAMPEVPAVRAVALVERLFALLHECRALVPQREAAGTEPEPVSAEAERLLYFALVGAIEAGLVRTAEDALTVLRQASAPLGPMGAEWLAQQERDL